MADQDDDSTRTAAEGSAPEALPAGPAPADEGLDPAALPDDPAALPDDPAALPDDPAALPDDPAAEVPAGGPAEEEPEEGAEDEADPAAGVDGDRGTPEATEQPAATAEAAEPAEPEETPFSRFGAHFSSPEPTAVVARPRRRATRPAGAAEPGDHPAPPPVSPTVPAFVSFVAPAEADEPPPPRRRSRRTQAESPAVEDEDRDDTPDTGDAETPGADEETRAPRSRRSRSRRRSGGDEAGTGAQDAGADAEPAAADEDDTDTDEAEDRDEGAAGGSRRRRRGRRGRGRGRSGDDTADSADGEDTDEAEDADEEQAAGADDEDDTDTDTAEGDEGGTSTRRRRRRRRRGSAEERAENGEEERPERAGRDGRTTSDDDVRGVTGSTRLEAKRQRRRDGRDSGRRRAPILTEAEFLARREAVDRTMVIRQRGERTQIAVLEDDVLVEHYVTQAQATSFAGNVYLGRVQNVLPSMEAAFIDIGKGRNAVLYAGEVNWDAAGLSGKQRSIEQALKSGDKVLVQVTKDPIGHKGARLTQQVNLPGRFLVYVPGGSMTGISRKLPDTERQRLKDILKKIVPEDAGVIIRTAAEGASEEELTRDVNRLKAQWEVIETKAEAAQNGSGGAPSLLYGEPDLAIRVIRDVFNEDFKELVVQGDDAWDTVEAYVAHVSPELSGRLTRHTGEGDVFSALRIDEQLAKALDRKVWLPSGGSLVIDRTEAMTVVDVNTGKFTGSGGNLEQTVTRNNMEAAEEIVRQLRLRDIGGIIVIDFIDMVLESNRDLVLRRLTECLGRDRTKHQVAEVTSLGLVQMTRKRVGQGLLEVFSEPCEHCRGRGVLVHTDPVDERRRGGNGGGNGRREPGRGGSAKEPAGKEPAGKEPAGKEPAGREPAGKEPAGKDAGAAEPGGRGAQDAEGEGEGQRSGGRRSRGRRNRSQAGEERAAEDAAIVSGAAGDDTGEAPAAEPVSTEPVSTEPVAAEPGRAQPADAVTADVATPGGDLPVPGGDVPAGTAAPADRPDTAPEHGAAPAPGADAAATAVVRVVAPLPPAPAAAGTDGEAEEEAVPPGAGPDDPGPADEPTEQAGEDQAARTAPAGAETAPTGTRPRRRRAASRPAGPPAS
ncbi:ribonuclease E/G [Geodermatophilus marinus]|uniref:ribonuclease E/G n=1 Tax=Geodermatophilus sp. LHW52908 TaxID=2303986 RepID=UPI0026C5B7A8|nr:ribonuclease E/G [Geodermatophilus sp. LHW52908]